MSSFKSEITEFFESLVSKNQIPGFVTEVLCCVPGMDFGPHDLSDDKFVMEPVNAHFGESAVSLKAIAIEKDTGSAGFHEYVIELSKRETAETQHVKISVFNVPQDMDGSSFCTEFEGYKFVEPVTKTVTAFK